MCFDDPLNLGGNHAVQDNRTTVARRDGASRLRDATIHSCCTGNYTNSDRRNQTATVTNLPLHFKAVSITQPDQRSSVSAANGILYQMSGSTEVALDGEAKMLNAGEGLFIAGGKTAALTAGSGGPSTFLHFFLAPRCGLGSACRDGACRREGIVSHTESDPRPEARRL